MKLCQDQIQEFLLSVQKFTVEVGTQGQGFSMLMPTSSVKEHRRTFRRDTPRRKGHGSGIKNTDKERIEMEDCSSGDRNTEDMKYKPHNSCDRENNKSCKYEGRPLAKFNTHKNLRLNDTEHLKIPICET